MLLGEPRVKVLGQHAVSVPSMHETAELWTKKRGNRKGSQGKSMVNSVSSTCESICDVGAPKKHQNLALHTLFKLLARRETLLQAQKVARRRDFTTLVKKTAEASAATRLSLESYTKSLQAPKASRTSSCICASSWRGQFFGTGVPHPLQMSLRKEASTLKS